MARDAYIYDLVRTPFGRQGGALAAVRPDDLVARIGTGAMRALMIAAGRRVSSQTA